MAASRIGVQSRPRLTFSDVFLGMWRFMDRRLAEP